MPYIASEIEAVLLTGGASSRMGEDKASILIDGIPMAERLVAAFRVLEIPMTNIGGKPIEGCTYLEDLEPFAGPLAALSAFRPSRDLVMVCSCDLPLFGIGVVELLATKIGDSEAAVPLIEGKAQPLCALYARGAFGRIPSVLGEGRKSVMAWLDALDVSWVGGEDLVAHGLEERAVLGVNSPEELRRALRDESM